jgi:hypothetical protein
MTQLIELSSRIHQNLKVVPSAINEFASKQHVFSLNAVEIAQAATCFPIFLSRNKINGNLNFSAMTSFLTEQNLFVESNQWLPVFQPSALRTYPLYLMQSNKADAQFTVGFDPQNTAFSETEGKPLFSAEGVASDHLTVVTKLLQTELDNMRHSFHLVTKLEELDLLKQIDLKVIFENGHVNTIKGLFTIDEDQFKMLPASTLAELNSAGYLMPIHALLMSIYQLNVLINKHNARPDNLVVKAIKMEVAKDVAHH